MKNSASDNRYTLSIVIPLYNEESVIQELTSRLDSFKLEWSNVFSFDKNSVEIIFVNDGSTDQSLNLLKEFVLTNPNYYLINLSRNHGHQLALTAGLLHARGDYVVPMDGDLQDPPEFIIDLYQKCLEGYDIVYAKRRTRKDESFFKRVTAKIFYRFLKRITRVNIPVDTGDFRIMSRRAVTTFKNMPEKNRFIRGMTAWIGFNQTSILYDRDERRAGKTKFNFQKMMNFAFDGITSFSSFPLKLATYMGYITMFFSLIYILYVLYQTLVLNNTIKGWSSIVILILFISSLQFLIIGLLGEYIGRIYTEVKGRPLYIIDEIIGMDKFIEKL